MIFMTAVLCFLLFAKLSVKYLYFLGESSLGVNSVGIGLFMASFHRILYNVALSTVSYAVTYM